MRRILAMALVLLSGGVALAQEPEMTQAQRVIAAKRAREAAARERNMPLLMQMNTQEQAYSNRLMRPPLPVLRPANRYGNSAPLQGNFKWAPGSGYGSIYGNSGHPGFRNPTGPAWAYPEGWGYR